MKTIKVTNWKGNEFEGSWNEKTYPSQIEDKNLIRIYVSDTRIHITAEELEKIQPAKKVIVSEDVIARIKADEKIVKRINKIKAGERDTGRYLEITAEIAHKHCFDLSNDEKVSLLKKIFEI